MLYQLFWLFLAFSFLGWCLEVAATAVRLGQYRDRGVLHGPLCLVYGITGCLITIALRELSGGWFFLFLFSALYATVVEWIAGHLLEHYSHTRWWDYSDRKWNLDGYICLSASVVWGALGLVTVKWLVPLLIRLYQLVPAGLAHVLLWIFAILLVIDLLGTALTLGGLRYKLPRVDEVNNRLANLTLRMGLWIFDRTERRMRTKAPQLDLIRPKRTKSTVFAAGCSFYKIFLLFVIGAFLGDITETIFCRITAGYWMSRSSLVWGPFSVVWGLALVLAAILLRGGEQKSESRIFWFGVILGGAYEYVCSAVTELLFGTVFWDYSGFKFNLGGRINLLYCFFWGIAAVTWIRYGYPLVAKGMKAVKRRIRPWMTALLAVFMAVNLVTSALALARYDARTSGAAPANAVDVLLDEHFDNARMERIYPNAKKVEKAG